MWESIERGLDAASARPPGTGDLDLGAYLHSAGQHGRAGVSAAVEARLSDVWSTYGRGELGVAWDPVGARVEALVEAGLRARW